MIVTCEKIKLCIRWIATAKETPWQFSIWPQNCWFGTEFNTINTSGSNGKATNYCMLKVIFVRNFKKCNDKWCLWRKKINWLKKVYKKEWILEIEKTRITKMNLKEYLRQVSYLHKFHNYLKVQKWQKQIGLFLFLPKW